MQKGDFRGARLFKPRSRETVLYETLFEQFYKSAEIKGRAVDTLRTYKHHNKYFLDFLCYKTESNSTTCDIISLELVESYISYLQQLRTKEEYILQISKTV